MCCGIRFRLRSICPLAALGVPITHVVSKLSLPKHVHYPRTCQMIGVAFFYSLVDRSALSHHFDMGSQNGHPKGISGGPISI